MPKVSVLIPVYNAAAFLDESLNSLLAQTCVDWEAVCVDDASTDRSLQVLRQYAAADSRIRVHSLSANVGACAARQEGLRLASGELVTMLDADDWLASDALEQMLQAFETDAMCDCALYDLRMVTDGDETTFNQVPDGSVSGQEAFRLSLDWHIHGVTMMRTALCRQNEGVSPTLLNSDELLTRLHYLHSRRVCQGHGVYYYRQHTASSTKAVSVRRFDILCAEEQLRQLLVEYGQQALLPEFEQSRWLRLVDLYMFYHSHGHQLTEAERQTGLAAMRRVWASIDRRLIKKETRTKFGYRPCRWWWLFRLQQFFYFTLRDLLGRNR